MKKRRQQFHRTVAEALEAGVPGGGRRRSRNCSPTTSPRPGDAARAVGYWLKAGQRARERSANAEAIRHLTRGLELLAGRPEGPDRDAEELRFRLPLAASYIAVRGYAAPEVEEHIRGPASCASGSARRPRCSTS